MNLAVLRQKKLPNTFCQMYLRTMEVVPNLKRIHWKDFFLKSVGFKAFLLLVLGTG